MSPRKSILRRTARLFLHILLFPWYVFLALRCFSSKPMRRMLDDPNW